MTAQPLVFNIRRFSLDDGPGIRTTVFLKGCPLACAWCHNPEALGVAPDLTYRRARCIRCGECAAVCPAGTAPGNDPPPADRERCKTCGACAEACPTRALSLVGTHYPVAELVALLLRDRRFFETSGGGVTFSGGEPTQHVAYLRRALEALQALNIHTAIQTCGLFDGAEFSREILPYTDLIHYDLKLLDPEAHEAYTGRSNGVILENFAQLTRRARSKLVPRIPLVPGITATPENLREIARFLGDLGHAHCDLLPYNPGGMEKRAALGWEVPRELLGVGLDLAQEEELRASFQEELCRNLVAAA